MSRYQKLNKIAKCRHDEKRTVNWIELKSAFHWIMNINIYGLSHD